MGKMNTKHTHRCPSCYASVPPEANRCEYCNTYFSPGDPLAKVGLYPADCYYIDDEVTKRLTELYTFDNPYSNLIADYLKKEYVAYLVEEDTVQLAESTNHKARKSRTFVSKVIRQLGSAISRG